MWTAIISFIIVFTIVALAHEGGHYLWAKKAGVRVIEAGLGFGPALFSWKRGNTKYSLNLIPVLAYVNLAGIDVVEEKGDEEKIPENEKYYTKTVLQKAKSIAAGPLCNIALAIIIIYLLAVLVGMPVEKGNKIAQILPHSPAAAAGLKAGDSILSIGGQKTEKVSDIIGIIYKNADKKLDLEISRESKILRFSATPEYHKSKKIGMLGFMLRPVVEYHKTNPLTAVWTSLKEVAGMVVLIVVLLGQLLIGKIPLTALAGPVGIAQITGQVAHQGILQLLWFIAFLSVNLGVVNLLPLPALDGGRLVFIALEAFRGKAIDIKKENRFHQAGLMVLLSLLALITIVDIRRIMGW